MNPTLLSAIAFVGMTIFVFSRFVYKHERQTGRSHEASSNESAVLGLFLLGATAFDYVAVVANYS